MAKTLIGIALIIVLIGVTFLLYHIRSKQVSDAKDYSRVTLDSSFIDFKNEVADLARDNGSILTSDINYEVIAMNRKLINDSISDAYYGLPAARDVVIGLARNFTEKRFKDKEEIAKMINLEDYLFLDAYWTWEVLLYKLTKVHGDQVIPYLQKQYNITEKRKVTDYKWENGEQVPLRTYSIREFDAQKLRDIFEQELIINRDPNAELLTYSEEVDILAAYYESRLTGSELLDTLMQQKYDGMHFGASGSIRYMIDGNLNAKYRATNSLWLQIDANWVLFSFMDFKTIEKMRKIENQLVSYGSAPPMTEKKPFKVTDGFDGSRRVAIRPGAGESWFYSQRNFVLNAFNMKTLLDKPYVHNWQMPAKLIRFLILAEQTTAFTGQQNTGKTSLMKAAFEFIEDKNIRVLEMSFELALRELYPWKDTFTVKPTDYVTSENLQDLLKKTDAWVSAVGEVAENIVAARMIQFCLIASAFTLFSHHGKDDEDLIRGLAQSLVACGEYHDHTIAMSTVLDAIKHNVHLGFTERKERVIEYISEIIKLNEIEPYPEIADLLKKSKSILKSGLDEDTKSSELAQVWLAYTMLTKEYYTRTTDRIQFNSRKIIVFNTDTMAYEPCEWYTESMMKNILYNLPEAERQNFVQFYLDNWVNKKYLYQEEVF